MPHIEQSSLPGMPPYPVDVERRNAFGRVMDVRYFGVDPGAFAEVTSDAYKQTDPEVLKSGLYRVTDTSMRLREVSKWVVMSSAEYAIVPDFPEALARKAQARNLGGSYGAVIRPQAERVEAATRAGAHALEPKVKPMKNLLEGYGLRLDNLRRLKKEIPYHWHAHVDEGTMRASAESLRSGVHEALQVVADTDGWTDDDLRLAKTGLDKRLLSGKGNERLNAKKEAWLFLTKVIGNYTIAKQTIVQDRLGRTTAEIERRLGNR
jgi:hypothetical protein